VQNDIFEIGILVMAVRVPAGGNQINFHVAGNWRLIFKLQNCTAKIWSALGAGKTGMQHTHIFSVRRFELVALEALVLPDGLQQFFRRRGTGVAQDVDGAALLAPDGVEVFRAGVHAAVFCATGRNVKVVKLLIQLRSRPRPRPRIFKDEDENEDEEDFLNATPLAFACLTLAG
jgi:hypothetical protein